MRSEGSAQLRVIDLPFLAGEDLAMLPNAELRAELLSLIGALRSLQAQITRRVDVFDTRGLSVDDGCRSTRGWLRSFGRLSEGGAGAQVRAARALRDLPILARASQGGEMSWDHLNHVAGLVRRVGVEPVLRVEAVLADAARRLDPSDFGQVCDRVRAHADPDGEAAQAARDFQRRYLTIAPFDGMVLVRGQLDPEGGAALVTALDALMPPPGRDETRDPGQRRADALVELARGALVEGRLPVVGGARPQVGVLVSPEQLIDMRSPLPVEAKAKAMAKDAFVATAAGANTDLPWLDRFGGVVAPMAQRIACDAEVWRVVLDPATGQPMDVGRKHRLVPHWIRRALTARDRGCRFPGCRAPASWTDAHHLVPWSRGGRTDISNLVSLCRFHRVF